MNIWCFIVLSLVITSSSSFYQKTGEDDEEVLIVDTDIGGGGCNDVDDVGAICVALELERLGETRIAAIVQNSQPPACTGVISVLTHYYNRDEIPIGAYKGPDLLPKQDPLPYVDDLVSRFPHPISNSSQVPDAVKLYRKILSNQPDRSVVISSIGLMTNLAALLQSEPDEYSDLWGKELFRDKVKRLAVMGGKYPTSYGTGFAECNFCGGTTDHIVASHDTYDTFSQIPSEVQVIFSGFEVGVEVQSGGRLSDCAAESNPCRAAYIDYEGGPNKSRFSWDPLTTLVAVRGASAAACSYHHHHNNKTGGGGGHNVINSTTGDNQWIDDGIDSNQTYLVLHNATFASNALDDLLCN